MVFSTYVFAEVRPTAKEFPNKTIIIGDYAIALDAFTDEVYKLAQESANENGQYKIYFKSDINSGTWYDITNSTDISQISTTTDNIVTNQVIDDLDIKYYTKPTGETVDFKSGETIYISTITDLENPENMEELEEIVTELEIQKSLKENGNNNDIIDDKINSMENVLSPVVLTENSSEFDKNKLKEISDLNKQLENIEKAAIALNVNNNSGSITSVIGDKKTELLNKRESLYYDIIYNRLEEETKSLDYNESGDLIEKYAKAMTSIKSSQIALGISDDENNTRAESLENSLDKKLNEALLSGDENGILSTIEDKATLEDIKSNNVNVTEDALKKQTEMLQDLKNSSNQSLTEAISNVNQNEEYKKALTDGTSQGALEKLRMDMATEISDVIKDVMEVDDMLNSRITDRAQKLNNLKNTENLINSALNNVIADIKSQTNDLLSSLLDENKNKIDEIELSALPEYVGIKESIKNITGTINNMYEDYMGAVENNNINTAKAIKDVMENLSELKNNSDLISKSIEDEIKTDKAVVDVSNGKATGENIGNILNNATNQMVENNNAISNSKKVVQDAINQENTQEQQLESSQTTQTQSDTETDDRYTETEATQLNNIVSNLGNGYLPPWKIKFNDYNVKLMSPVFINGKEIYVPAEELAYQIGAYVIRSNTNSAIVIRKSGGLIEYIPNDTNVYVNDKKTSIKPAPTALYNGKIYLPLSCFEKAFGFTHVEVGNTIIVNKK